MPARIWTGKASGLSGIGFRDAQNIAAGPPPGYDPYSKGGRVPARWT